MTVARELFGSKGFENTSVRDIMTACNLTPGALYHHYPSKERLLFELMMDPHLELEKQLQSVLDTPWLQPPERLARLIYLYIRYQLQDIPRSRVVSTDLTQLPPELAGEINLVRRRFKERFRHVVDEGIATRDFEIPDVSLFLVSIFTTAKQFWTWFKPDGPATAHEVAAWNATFAVRVATCAGREARVVDTMVSNALRDIDID